MKLSIITAVYNNRTTIADAIESVLQQDYPDVEYIVIDGASTDGTIAVLERYRDQIDHLVSEPDEGIYDALNKGLALATGDVVGFLHSDDLYADHDALTRIMAPFLQQAADATYGDLQYVRRDNVDAVVRHWRSRPFHPSLLRWGWMPAHPTFYMRRKHYIELGGFDTRYRIAADFDSMLRYLSKPGVRVEYIPSVLIKMRVGGVSNRSLCNLLQKSREDYAALRHNRLGGMGALLIKNLSKIQQFLIK